MRLNILSDFFQPTGYACHARNFASALYKINKEISVETQAPQNWQQLVTPEERIMLENDYKKDVNISITTPPNWPLKSADRPKKHIGFGVFEGDRIPTGFIEPANSADELFVPSKHVYDAFKPFVDKKISIVPEGVDLNVYKEVHTFHPQMEDFNHGGGSNPNMFTFMWNKGWAQGVRDRSGFDVAIKAFCEEFTKKDDVRFMAHINPAYNHPNWRIDGEISLLNLPPAETRPPILVMVNDLPSALINQFYNFGDVYVSTSKAEGFCLPILESFAVGKPTITTNYGGQLDFCNSKNSWLVDGEMKPACDQNIQFEETKWCYPSIENVRKAMREAYENRELVKKKGLEARKTAERFTWENAAKVALKLIDS